MTTSITTPYAPDILNCIANLSSQEVFTSPELANRMLDCLPREVWGDPALRFLDPCVKSGVFLRECARRLMVGLAAAIPDENQRRQHVFQNMLFGIGTTQLAGRIGRRTLYCNRDATAPESVVRMRMPDGNIVVPVTRHRYRGGACEYCGAAEDDSSLDNHAYPLIHPSARISALKALATQAGLSPSQMRFDVIIGNPPYQLQDAGDSTGASPLYNKFVEQALELKPRYVSMIIPSRWFAGGKGLGDFRKKMLQDRRMRHLVDFQDAGECFPNVEIKGGVCYFLWDAEHNGPCTVQTVLKGVHGKPVERALDAYDVFVRFNEAVGILEKVRAKNEAVLFNEVAAKSKNLVSTQKPFGFRTNFTGFSATQSPGDVEIYANKKTGWIARELVKQNAGWIDKHKVFLSAAYGAGNEYPHQIINTPIVVGPGTCCTETYMVCGPFDSQAEADNFAKYLKTRFFRFLVWLRKISQHNPQDRFSFVPALDMKTSWTDAALQARYGLTDEEVAFMESMIKEMP